MVRHDGLTVESLAFFEGRVRDATTNAPSFELDLRDHLVFPGLVNAHDHLQLNCIPRLPHEEPFGNSYEWIEAFERFRDDERVVRRIAVPSETRYQHGALKNLLAGTTTVAHHDPWQSVFAARDFPVAVPRNLAWAHSLGLGGSDGASAPKYGPRVKESFEQTRVSTPWVIHAAEGVDAVAGAEIARLDELKCLAPNTVVVHGVGMADDDIALVIGRGASIVWCPSSNVELFGRTLIPCRLHGKRRLALGTDSRLTGSRDLLDELRLAARESDLSPAELLDLVTAAAADVLRISGAGRLERNCPADCLIVRDHAYPEAALLGASRADLRAVVRGGVPVVADPDFAEWFAYCGVDAAAVRVDGRPKLLARHLARSDLAALEPGLEIS